MRLPRSGGGWAALRSSMRLASRVGWFKLIRALRRKNACKTCALGMGGQQGGMVNEQGRFPEVCKKSVQAMAADMQGAIQPAFFRRFSLLELGRLSPRALEAAGRLKEPLYAGPGDTHYTPLPWDQTLEFVADQIRQAGPARTFFYASGRASNEAGFLLQLFARQFGANFVNNCSFYCHQASGVGLTQALGTGTATLTIDDVEKADFFMLLGGNPASNHPRLMRSLVHLRRRGGQVVVVNPVREIGLVSFRVPSDWRSMLFGSQIASLYLQPTIGGDIALLAGIAKHLQENHQVDYRFVNQATSGFADFQQSIERLTWKEISNHSGLARDALIDAAQRYAAARSAVFAWTMGITHHRHGVENVRMIANLALLRGMVGKPGAGLLPIRGHSNVQGLGTMGVAPQLKETVLKRLEQRLGLKIPTAPGLDTMGCMQAAQRGEMRAAVCLGGNLFGSNPCSRFAQEALGRLECIAYFNTSLNTTHTRGRARHTLILPVLARDEEEQPTTQESMFNFVRLSDGGPRRLDGPRSEVGLVVALAQQVVANGPVDWSALADHAAIRRLIAETVPGLEQLGRIDQSRAEFHIPGRVLHAPRFATSDGKARFWPLALPKRESLKPNELRLMTVRSEGQFNTVVYEEEDLYRGQERRDVVLMNPMDLSRLGLEPDQRVTVMSDAGSIGGVLARPYDIHEGCALMYYPEANALVPTDVDPQSKTPSFKSVVIRIEPERPAVSAPAALPMR
jgi:molybdopterin-dependent oxidoreductase alpha subunit